MEKKGKLVNVYMSVEVSHQEVTWMSFKRLVKRSMRGTQSGPSRLSQLGCMYSLALRWASLSQHMYSWLGVTMYGMK